ncbi:MAG TPA: hypothetical protein VIJ15_12470 [Dermatophilaceae bacterium]
MVKKPSKQQDLPADFDHHVVLFPTRYAVNVPTKLPAESASPPVSGLLPTTDGGKAVRGVR